MLVVSLERRSVLEKGRDVCLEYPCRMSISWALRRVGLEPCRVEPKWRFQQIRGCLQPNKGSGDPKVPLRVTLGKAIFGV